MLTDGLEIEPTVLWGVFPYSLFLLALCVPVEALVTSPSRRCYVSCTPLHNRRVSGLSILTYRLKKCVESILSVTFFV